MRACPGTIHPAAIRSELPAMGSSSSLRLTLFPFRHIVRYLFVSLSQDGDENTVVRHGGTLRILPEFAERETRLTID